MRRYIALSCIVLYLYMALASSRRSPTVGEVEDLLCEGTESLFVTCFI